MILRRKDVAKLGPRWMPFADAASEDLPIGQLWRLALFQVSVGMAQVLLLGTLNRVMIVELSVPAMIVALMISIPVLVAPFRALLGHRSDTYRSALGWKRIPYLWFGSLWQMGGLAVMPFALIVLSGDQFKGPAWAGEVLAALAFLMAGLGMHMVQTAGLALAADRATEETRPRVVAMLYILYLSRHGHLGPDRRLPVARLRPDLAGPGRAGLRRGDPDPERHRLLEAGTRQADVQGRA
jgi:MFS transporter, BCD family, chlorophyll transporter